MGKPLHLLNASAPVSIQSFPSPSLSSTPQIIHSGFFPRVRGFVCLVSCRHQPLDPILCLVVVHGLLSLSQERVHALICTQEPVHTHNGFKGQDAAETSQRSTLLVAEGERTLKNWEGSPFHEVDHVDDARCTDHWLVGEDGPHGLFHTELRLQGRQKRLNFLSGYGKNKEKDYF